MIELHKVYYGPDQQRLVVMAMNTKHVTVASVRTAYNPELHSKMTVAAFKKFIKGSDRRNYTHKDGSRRIKVEEHDEHGVRYLTPEGTSHWVSAKEWSKWRKGVAA